jgi:hypothetical protein
MAQTTLHLASGSEPDFSVFNALVVLLSHRNKSGSLSDALN